MRRGSTTPTPQRERQTGEHWKHKGVGNTRSAEESPGCLNKQLLSTSYCRHITLKDDVNGVFTVPD